MKLRSTLLLLIGSLAGAASCAQVETDWGDPLAAFSFTEPATDPQAVVVPFQPPQTDKERDECFYYVRCHFYRVRRDSQPSKRHDGQQYTYGPTQGAAGLRIAIIGDEAQYAPLTRWLRLKSLCHCNFFATGDQMGQPIYSGQWSPDTPGVLGQVQPLDNGRLRVTFVPLASQSLTPTAALATSSLSVDVEPATWVAIPCELKGVRPGSSSKEVCDLLMFVSVQRPNARRPVVDARSVEPSVPDVNGDSPCGYPWRTS